PTWPPPRTPLVSPVTEGRETPASSGHSRCRTQVGNRDSVASRAPTDVAADVASTWQRVLTAPQARPLAAASTTQHGSILTSLLSIVRRGLKRSFELTR